MNSRRLAHEGANRRRHATTNLLGGSLAKQGRHDEAEPLLGEGYEGLAPPPGRAGRKRDALVRWIDHD